MEKKDLEANDDGDEVYQRACCLQNTSGKILCVIALITTIALITWSILFPESLLDPGLSRRHHNIATYPLRATTNFSSSATIYVDVSDITEESPIYKSMTFPSTEKGSVVNDIALEEFANTHASRKMGWMASNANFSYYVFQNIRLSSKVDQLCPNGFKEFGHGDGGKFYCDTGFLQEEDCTIFSIGSNGDYSFEGDVIRKSQFCKIHTFDCTGKYYPPSKLRSRVKFHRTCLGGEEEKNKPRFQTYAEMLTSTTSTGEHYAPKYFKMDIEGFEFNVFRSMLSDDNIRPFLPEQIAFELHGESLMKGITWRGRYKTTEEIDHFLFMIKELGGYEVVNIDHNPFCPHCTELVVMREVTRD